MRLNQLGEFGLIERLARRLPTRLPVKIGIGDDAAVLSLNRQEDLLFTTDMIIEGVHFRRSDDPYWIGWKAIGVNLSDIAAMAGEPTYAVVALGLPRDYPVEQVDRLYAGMKALARRFDVHIVGGDTDRAKALTIAGAMLGRVKRGCAVLRRGARPGDAILVTGSLGGSILGKHLRFVPRVREAQWLARHAKIHAMIDLSDGLSSDLRRICEQSRVGAVIEAHRIPVSSAAKQLAKQKYGHHPSPLQSSIVNPQSSIAQTLHHALHDGEDFELLFTCPPGGVAQLRRRFEQQFHLDLSPIGWIQSRRIIECIDASGQRIPLPDRAFRHF